MNKDVDKVIERTISLIEEAESYEFHKQSLMASAKSIFREYQEGRYTHAEYQKLMDDLLKGRSKDEWVEYYDSYMLSVLKKAEPLISHIIYQVYNDDSINRLGVMEEGFLRVSPGQEDEGRSLDEDKKHELKKLRSEEGEKTGGLVEMEDNSILEKLREEISKLRAERAGKEPKVEIKLPEAKERQKPGITGRLYSRLSGMKNSILRRNLSRKRAYINRELDKIKESGRRSSPSLSSAGTSSSLKPESGKSNLVREEKEPVIKRIKEGVISRFRRRDSLGLRSPPRMPSGERKNVARKAAEMIRGFFGKAPSKARAALRNKTSGKQPASMAEEPLEGGRAPGPEESKWKGEAVGGDERTAGKEAAGGEKRSESDYGKEGEDGKDGLSRGHNDIRDLESDLKDVDENTKEFRVREHKKSLKMRFDLFIIRIHTAIKQRKLSRERIKSGHEKARGVPEKQAEREKSAQPSGYEGLPHKKKHSIFSGVREAASRSLRKSFDTIALPARRVKTLLAFLKPGKGRRPEKDVSKEVSEEHEKKPVKESPEEETHKAMEKEEEIYRAPKPETPPPKAKLTVMGRLSASLGRSKGILERIRSFFFVPVRGGAAEGPEEGKGKEEAGGGGEAGSREEAEEKGHAAGRKKEEGEPEMRFRFTLGALREAYRRMMEKEKKFVGKKVSVTPSIEMHAMKKEIKGLPEEEEITPRLLKEEVESIKKIMEGRKHFKIYHPSFLGSLANATIRKFAFYLIEKYPSFFKTLYDNLRLANITILSNTYVNIMLLTTIIVAAISSLLFFAFFIFTNNPLMMAVIKTIIMAVLSAGVTFLMFYMYPQMKANSRKTSIDTNLPFAINHISAVAGAGVPPTKMFRLLMESEEYGEIAVEIEKIVEYVELFGYDLLTAIRSVAMTTPSLAMKEFLEGMVSTIESGGDISVYLKEKTSEAMLNYELERQKYAETIATYSDVYTGILIAAPLFFIVALSLVSMLGGTIGGLDVSTVIVVGAYVIIPLLNIAFITLLELTQPNM
ncbi:MAG: type II secretion system F family protein [Candidatus Woesearchaeota archaeon]